MSNSLFTGVTGLRINQQMLDVVGNNLANSNTTAFKSQSVQFSDLIYQTITQATNSSTDAVGGTNPIQIGLGAQVAGIAPDLEQGSLESTGRDLDLALQGSGFFAARNGTEVSFTRAGSFAVDADNLLVDPANGFRVQRFGTVGEGSPTSPAFQISGNNDVRIPIGTGIPGNATGDITMQGNLSANAIGPLAQVLTSAQPFKAGGVPATAATLLNSLDENVVDYIATDQLRLQGLDTAGNPVDVTIPVGPATTMGDLITGINANFPGSTASLDAAGNIRIVANAVGPSQLNVSINEVPGSTGSTMWGNHNLFATTIGKDGDTVKTGIQIFDKQGASHNLNLIFQKQGNNVWDMTAVINPTEGILVDNLVSTIMFNEDGSFRQVIGTGLGDATISVQFNGFSTPQRIGFGFGTPSAFDGLTQVGGSSSAVATGQDGYAAGFLTSLSIGQDGVMNGIFTNGRTLPIAQLAIASFANPAALNRIGGNYYSLTSESGPALLGAGLSGGRGSVQQKALESSNVDVALEFTRLIIAQRGFQVNARMITASDQTLQELANILR
ncbi:MAG: flagellar hook protein FlgE [Planctomycetes bacterium]|nr:flagellar hook protein FlgE [Planctomycetota bacterium]